MTHSRLLYGLLAFLTLILLSESPFSGAFLSFAQSAPVVPPSKPGYRLQPYNDGRVELDLSQLEFERQLRSKPLISTDGNTMVYSEVIFMPHSRQTRSSLYRVNVEDTRGYEADKLLQFREELFSVGNTGGPFAFQTLTPIDWTPDNTRLLFKEKSGVLHTGLRTSQIWVYDAPKNDSLPCIALQKAIEVHWKEIHDDSEAFTPALQKIAWDLYPLGWEAGSNSRFLVRAMAYDQTRRQFLGIWRFDIDALQAELVSTEDTPTTISANGFTPSYFGTADPFNPKQNKRKGRRKKGK